MIVVYSSIHIFHSCISHPFYGLKTSPILQSHVIIVFIRYIATPSNHIFFRMAYPMLFAVVSQRFRATNQPYPNPFLFPQLHTVHPNCNQLKRGIPSHLIITCDHRTFASPVTIALKRVITSEFSVSHRTLARQTNDHRTLGRRTVALSRHLLPLHFSAAYHRTLASAVTIAL